MKRVGSWQQCGKLECALFGEYVNELRNFLQQEDHVQVIVVVQLARVKTFKPLAVVLDNSREGLEADFMKLHPKKSISYLSLIQEDVTGDGYPSVLDSLIGQKNLFKVETKVAQSRQFEGSYPVRRICVDKDVIDMFDLAGADLIPSKQIDSGIIGTPIAFGDDESASGIKCTPAKRKLVADFASCQVAAEGTRVKVDAAVEVGDEDEPACALVPVKIEKD